MIEVLEKFDNWSTVTFVLELQIPVGTERVVGASVRTQSGTLLDLPARRIWRSGTMIWSFKPPLTDKTSLRTFTGEAIFALWEDSSFRNRITDTGWVAWAAYSPIDLIGSSLAGVRLVEEALSQYRERAIQFTVVEPE